MKENLYFETTQYNYIDVIRGMAVLGVIAVHSHQQIPNLFVLIRWIFNYGQLGVQLFFIASALTLCLSAKERSESSPYNFYIRRYFRIAPLYYFAIILYMVFGSLMIYLRSNEFSIPSQYNVLAVISNIFLVHGLYPPGNNLIVPGGWSIGTEVLFYIVFPILYKVLARISLSTIIQLFFIVFLGIFSIEYIINKLFGANVDNNAFLSFSILNQLPVFLIGIYTFRVLATYKITKKKIVSGILLGLMSCFLLNINFKTGFNSFLAPIFSGLSFITLIFWLKTKNLSTSWPYQILKNIGKVSYSMYILHFLILDIVSSILNQSIFKLITNPVAQLFIIYSLVVITAFYLARISKRLIEDKGILFGKNFLCKSP